MSRRYASGKNAVGICARSGRKMLLKDMVSDGQYPNMLVDPDWFEGRHPQELLPKVSDPVGLYRPAPDPSPRPPFCYESRPVFNPRTGLIEFEQVYVGGPGCPPPPIPLIGFGQNSFGQLAIDSGGGDVLTPTEGAAANWLDAVVGERSSLMLAADGLYGVGDTSLSALGIPPQGNISVPALIMAGDDFDDFAVSSFAGLVIRAGVLLAFGTNSSNKLGTGTLNETVESPTQVGSFEDWSMVSMGSGHAAAIRDGKLYTWGTNQSGRTGQGTNLGSTPTPTQITAHEDWVFVTCGTQATMAIRANGTLWGCGVNTSNALGDGTNIAHEVMTQIGSATDWVEVALSSLHGFGIRGSGALYSWGTPNNGRTGRAQFDFSNAMTQITSDTDWTHVACGSDYSFAMRDGRVYVCGNSQNGRAGIYPETGQIIYGLTEISGLQVSTISAISASTLAIKRTDP